MIDKFLELEVVMLEFTPLGGPIPGKKRLPANGLLSSGGSGAGDRGIGRVKAVAEKIFELGGKVLKEVEGCVQGGHLSSNGTESLGTLRF